MQVNTLVLSDFRYVYNLIKQGEGLHLDFKQRITSEVKIARTLVSFANTEGGRLLVGIADDGEVIGVDVAQEKHVLIRAAKQYCEPAIFLRFKELNTERKTVLEVEVERKKHEHRARDEAGRWFPFERVGDQSVLSEEYNGTEADSDPIPILLEQNAGLMNYLDRQEAISVKEYMQMMSISYHVAQRSLDELVNYGVLEKEDRGGRLWYFMKE